MPTLRCCHCSSQVSGFKAQWQVKRSLFCPEDNVLKDHMEFDHIAGIAVSWMHSKHPELHQARLGQESTFRYFSRSHGSCIHDDKFGPPAYEIVSVVAQRLLSQEVNDRPFSHGLGCGEVIFLISTAFASKWWVYLWPWNTSSSS